MIKSPIILSVLTAIVLTGLMVFVGIVAREPELGGASLTDLEDKYNQATEIKDKYDLVEGTLVRETKSDPKDRIVVVIGNKTSPESFGAETSFEPTIEITRWDEVSFKIIPDLSDVALEDRTLSFDKEKILFDTPKMSFEIYEYTEGEGGMKYIWYLNEKPEDRTVCFDMESEGLDFYYQPELTQKEIDNGAFRPEDIVGSYAIYHSTKGGMNDINGKEYKVGKFGHIPTPKLYDSNGWELFAERLLIENNKYCIVMPEYFWDKAVYPIKSNDRFGNESEGVSHNAFQDYIRGSSFAGAIGDGISISAWTSAYTVAAYKFALYKHSDSTKVKETDAEDGGGEVEGETSWKTLEFTSSPELTAIDYVIVGNSAGAGDIYYDSGGTNLGHRHSHSYASGFPSPISFDHNNVTFSIYVTYDPAGAEPEEQERRIQGMIMFE